MFKRAQAAMEFLMTYGWAILVVLAAIGALAYFGVLSPGNLLPQKCTFPAGFDCTETPSGRYNGGSGIIQLALTNSNGYDVNVTPNPGGPNDGLSIATADDDLGCTAVAIVPRSGAGTLWENGDAAAVTISSCGSMPNVGERYKTTLTIDGVVSANSGLSHAIIGDVSGKTGP